jgi:hypothetical protein
LDRPVELTSSRLIFRFLVGGTELAGEWLGAALRALEELPPPPTAQGRADVVPSHRVADVLVGALSSALRWRPPGGGVAAASRGAALATQRGLRLLSLVPGAGIVKRQYRDLRVGIDDQVRRWGEEGAREALAGRRLARLATPSFFELVMARLADSPELRGVIEEQSVGVAAASVAELRDRSEAADRAVQRVVDRIVRSLGRRRSEAGVP